MFRFIMPDPSLPFPVILESLRTQFDAFLRSEPLRELFSVLGTDSGRLRQDYNGRTAASGAVRETMELSPSKALEDRRAELYPLFSELGFIGINRPIRSGHSHILVLGGSLDACHDRSLCAARFAGEETETIDGLACYRPVSPGERASSSFRSGCETEFGAMADSFSAVFGLAGEEVSEAFAGDRNLNRISCVRTTRSDSRTYRVFAAPSKQPELRRADTGDSLLFYLEHTPLTPEDSLLAVTNNRYCNRQFLQLVWQFLRAGQPVRFDIIGCFPDERLTSPERYDPFQYLQDLIGILDWIERFDQLP